MLYFAFFLFFCFFAYLAWRNMVWAIAFIAAFLPAYLIRFHLGSIPMTLLEGMVLILFVVWIIKLKVRNEKLKIIVQNLKLKNWWPIILIWLIVATIAVFVSPNLRAAAGIWKAYFIEPILFLIVFIDTIRNRRNFELIFYALGFSVLYISAFAIYQKFTGIAISNPLWQAEETRRVTSFYGYPNAIGLYLAPIVTFYVGWLINNFQFPISNFQKNFKFQILNFKTTLKDKRLKIKTTIFQLAVIVLSILSIVFARSEGAYVGIFIGLIFLGLMIKKLRWVTVVGIIVLVLIISLTPQFKSYVWQQISFQDVSGKVRISMWQETLEMLKDRPILGAGLAGYQETFAPYHQAKHIEIYLYPHNLFLNFWSELGLAGLIIFLWIVVKFFKTSFRNAWHPLTAAMITLLIHGLVDVPYFKNDLSILFWMIIAVLIVVKNNQGILYGVDKN